MLVRPFVMGGFLFMLKTQSFWLLSRSFLPRRTRKRGNRAGSSRNESEYSRRGTQISFPLFESRRREKKINCVVRTLAVEQNGGSDYFFHGDSNQDLRSTYKPTYYAIFTAHIWSWLLCTPAIAIKLKNELVRIFRNCDSLEAGNWSGYVSESSQTHSEKSRLDFLYGAKANLKAKQSLFAT